MMAFMILRFWQELGINGLWSLGLSLSLKQQVKYKLTAQHHSMSFVFQLNKTL